MRENDVQTTELDLERYLGGLGKSDKFDYIRKKPLIYTLKLMSTA